MARALVSVGRALGLTVARDFRPAATALAVGTLLFAAIPFGGNGVRPSDVVHAMDRWLVARATLWALWLTLSAPVCIGLVGAAWVRTLPVRTAHAVGWLILLGLLAQAPWMLLLGLGAGPARGLGAGLLSLSIAFALATGARGQLVLAIVAVLAPLPSAIVLALGAALAVPTARRAWIAGPREPSPPRRLVRRSPAIVAVAVASLVDVLRGERVRVARAAALSAAVAGLLVLLRRNQPVDGAVEWTRAIGVLALPAAMVAAWLVPPLAAAADRLHPLVASIGRSPRVLRAGAVVVVASAFFFFGAGAGVGLGGVAVPILGAWSASLALLVLGRAGGPDPSRLVVAATVLGAGALVLVIFAGGAALPIVVVFGCATATWEMR